MLGGQSYNPIPIEGYDKSASARLLTTGATERNSVAGIYDLAGNVEEWTLEKMMYSDCPCSIRGGTCRNYGSGRVLPAATRIGEPTFYISNGLVSDSRDGTGLGFRPALY